MSDLLREIAEVRRLKAMRTKLREERAKRKAATSSASRIVETSTEDLFTQAFGIDTATPCQRAAARILDGLPLGELADDSQVVEFVGGADVAELLRDEGHHYQELTFLAAVRGAKTFLACAAAIRMTQTVDTTSLKPGEVPRVSLVSIRIDQAEVAYGYLRAALEGPLKHLLLDEPKADSLLVRGRDRPIEIKCVAGSKAGGGLVARWAAGVVFDEAPRMAGKDDGVVNLDDSRTAVLGRLLPGAQALYIGSPWAPFGKVYELVQEFWKKPSKQLIVLRGTGPMLNPFWWTPERCEQLREQDETAYQTDVLGEFANPESGLIGPALYDRLKRDFPDHLPPRRKSYGAGVDPSEGGAGGNGWTLVIVERDGERYRTAFNHQWRGARPSEIWAEVAAVCHRYGIDEAQSDQYAASTNEELAEQAGLRLVCIPDTQPRKLEDYKNVSTLAQQGLLEFPPDPLFRRDLLSVVKRVTQQSQSIALPRTSDGRHCDYAPAFVKALRAAMNAAPRLAIHDEDEEHAPQAYGRGFA
jgi:hypothetical protein